MARVAIAPKKNTLASHSRLRISTLSSSISRSGRVIRVTNSRMVVSNPRSQKTKASVRENLAMRPPSGRIRASLYHGVKVVAINRPEDS
jgi:hypothetical protein